MKGVIRQWVTDWRTIAAITAAVLVGLLAVMAVTSIQDRGRALDAAKAATVSEREARQAAVHHIDQLLAQISTLQQEAKSNGRQLALLREEITLLQRQIREMGGQPVVVGAGGGTSSSMQERPRGPSPSPSPARSRHPSPKPDPAPSICVAGVCLPSPTDLEAHDRHRGDGSGDAATPSPSAT